MFPWQHFHYQRLKTTKDTWSDSIYHTGELNMALWLGRVLVDQGNRLGRGSSLRGFVACWRSMFVKACSVLQALESYRIELYIWYLSRWHRRYSGFERQGRLIISAVLTKYTREQQHTSLPLHIRGLVRHKSAAQWPSEKDSKWMIANRRPSSMPSPALNLVLNQIQSGCPRSDCAEMRFVVNRNW